jgi:integrase
MILCEAIDRFLMLLKEKGGSEAHLKRTRHALMLVVERWGKAEVRTIKRGELVDFCHALRRKDGRAYARASRAGIHRAIKSFFRWAEKKKLVEKNPAKKLPAYDYTPTRDRSIPAGELRKLMGAIEPLVARYRGSRAKKTAYARDVRDALIVCLVLDSSGRRGEVNNIERGEAERALRYPVEVDFLDGRGMKHKGHVYPISTWGKTDNAQLVMTERTAELLREWLRLTPKAVWLFTSEKTGRAIDPRSINRAFEKLCKFAKIPTYHPHSIRKRNITDLARSADTQTASKVAGHKDINVTLKHYIMADGGRVQAAALMLNHEREGDNRPSDEDLLGNFFRHAGGN